MMPRPYPDELLYSVFARLFVRRGYLSYRDIAEELYDNVYYFPSHLFVNLLRREPLLQMKKIKPMEDWIMENTMFPYFSHFLPEEKKKEAFEALLTGENKLPMPKFVQESLLYCPECVREDREKYGEAYWHCAHQIQGIRICAKHRCILQGSSALLKAANSPNFVPLEHEDIKKEVKIENDETIIGLADFMMDFVHKDTGIVRESLRVAAEKKGYGTYHNIQTEKLYKDICKNYTVPPFAEHYVTDALRGKRNDWHGMCILWKFLEAEAVYEAIPDREKKIFEESAEILNMDYTLVCIIGKEVLMRYKAECGHTGGRKKADYNMIDKKNLPAVKETVKRIYLTPERVTKTKVSHIIGLPQRQIDNLPLCLKEIEEYEETQEEYWCRLLAYTIEELEKENIPICFRRIRERTNIRARNIVRCIPYMSEDLKEKLYPHIRDLKELENITLLGGI